LLSIGAAAVLCFATFIGSARGSCGAFDSGPNPGAEASFCGYRSGEAGHLSVLFVLVQLIPALPVLAGGALAFAGRSRAFVAAGVGLGLLTTLVIWKLEP
jgi:hypothetical protein